MRWKGETKKQRVVRAKLGIRCFAFLPQQMPCGTWVWLGYYWKAVHFGVSGRSWWVYALEREDCVQTAPRTTPPPKK